MERNNNNNRNIWKKIGIGLGVAGGVILGIALIPITMGFGGAGIVAGSIAAGIQAGIGNVAAGSLFAILTSLGMTGALATTATVGAIIGAGGLGAYLIGRFNPDNDAQLIHEIMKNNDNPDLLMSVLEYRKPKQREKIMELYKEKYDVDNDSLRCKIVSFLPDKHKKLAQFLLTKTEGITGTDKRVKEILDDLPLSVYLDKEIDYQKDAYLINTVIECNDLSLIITRLLEFREVEQIKKIEAEFLKMRNGEKKDLLSYLIDFVPPFEKDFIKILITGQFDQNNH